MLEPSHPLAALQAQAALSTGWPTLHVFARTEAAILAALSTAEGVLGRLPQADLIQPWEPEDVEEPWELRIDLPELDPARWLLLQDRLIKAGTPGGLVAGLSAGSREAIDEGQRAFDYLDGVNKELTAYLHFDADDGGVLSLDLAKRPPDELMLALEKEFVDAIRTVDPGLSPTTDRGADTLQPVVHRTTGRVGLLLSLDSARLDPLPGDALQQRRRELVTALAGAISRRATHPVVRVAPELQWDTRFGLSFLLWLITPPAVHLPGDEAILARAHPAAAARRVEALDGLVEELELHVVGEHDDVIASVSPLAEEFGLLGGRPRWLQTADGWRFLPTWRWLLDGALPDAVNALLTRLPQDIARLVPGEPVGMGEDWPRSDPAWKTYPGRWFLRLRSGVQDRDQFVETTERPTTPRDDDLKGALAPANPDTVRHLTDSLGREGLELTWQNRWSADRIDAVLYPLSELEGGLTSLATFGFRGELLVVRLWYRK